MTRAALLAVFVAATATAQTDPKTAALDAFLASGSAPRLSAFLTAADARAAFAAVAPDDRSARDDDWKACEALLAGGKRDPDGAAVRAALAKLPPQQVYFAARLRKAAKALHDELGNGYLGNAKENLGMCTGRKCYERADTLQRRAEPLLKDPAFRHWDSASVDAEPGAASEHTAACFSFYPGSRGGPASVELVADAWDDAFVPAETWFAVHDRATHQALAAAGKDWCGPTLAAVRKPQRDKLVERENREEERMKKLKELGASFSRMRTDGF
ncbi:MAG: hypothetical protein HY079_01570 [Elusimicrobia bacterium]|nr:hypothetical protein [Elusimicrobiota bacterium]